MQPILSLVWFKIYPPLFGGQKGIALFNKHLARHYDVDCLCSNDNRVLKNMGANVLPELTSGKQQFFHLKSWRHIWQQLRKRPYAWLIIEFPYYGLAAFFLKPRRTKLILHTHNIEWLRFKSLNKKTWKLLYYYEQFVYRNADLVLFKTEEERLMAQKEFKLKQQQTYVLPYGVERAATFDKAAAQAEIRKRHNLKMEDKILLFAGTLDYAPNAQAVTLLYEKIEPMLRTKLSNFKILICGRNQFPEYGYLKKLHNENIIQAGQVSDIETYFTVTDVFLNPVQNVHGVQTKLFDALNFNLNVVSFKKAANEVPAYLHQKVFMSGEGDYEGFVQNVLATLTVTFDTPEAFYQEFSWERIVANFVTHLKNQEAST